MAKAQAKAKAKGKGGQDAANLAKGKGKGKGDKGAKGKGKGKGKDGKGAGKAPLTAAQKKAIRCRFWKAGSCSHGDACEWGHTGTAGQALLMKEVVPTIEMLKLWNTLDENVQAHLASETSEWIVDSGASRHFVCRKALQDWEQIVQVDTPLRIKTANGVVEVRENLSLIHI